MRDYTKIEKKNCQLVTHYGGKEFKHPENVTTGPKNEIVIAEYDNKEVIITSKEQVNLQDFRLTRTFGQGSGDDNLQYPIGVAVHDVIAVSDYGAHEVRIYSLQGEYQSKFGFNGYEDGQFQKPRGLCFNSKGLLYVVDCGNCRVQVFRENNAFHCKFGSCGRQPGEFENPYSIAVDSRDQVYVTDWCDNHSGISVFGEGGAFIKKIDCKRPKMIGITPDDYLITNNQNVLIVFNPNHKCIAKFGETGKEKGQFDGICGIAIDKSGSIFVTEFTNHRLQIIW